MLLFRADVGFPDAHCKFSRPEGPHDAVRTSLWIYDNGSLAGRRILRPFLRLLSEHPVLERVILISVDASIRLNQDLTVT